MNQKIKEYLVEYCKKQGWDYDEDSDLIEVLQEAKEVYREIGDSHRWYDNMFIVVEVDGMLIGYDWYHITGDNNVNDMGLKFDLDSICEVEKKQKTIDYYEPKENE